MGRLRQVTGEAERLLPQRCIVGRSRACSVRFGEPEVSGEHARLRWTGRVWELQDLHSRNGTFIDGRRLAPGECAAVTVGTVLGFGRPESCVLVDGEAPALLAVPLGGGAPVEARDGLLALPDPAAPEVMIFREVGGWMVERGGVVAEIADGEVLRLGEDAWQVHLPEPLPQTREAAECAPALDSITLRFNVSRDEEYIEVVALHGARSFDLKARSHHYTLLILARARLRDQALPLDHQGWVHQNNLLAMLRVDASHLNLNIYRLRQQFEEAGIAAAAQIVERRVGTRRLRIGVSRIEICTLEHER